MIMIYTTKSCVPCIYLKRYLDNKGWEYRTLDADNEHNLKQLIHMTGQFRVPTVFIDGKFICQGLNYGAINKAMQG